jgi:hypothetical protein
LCFVATEVRPKFFHHDEFLLPGHPVQWQCGLHIRGVIKLYHTKLASAVCAIEQGILGVQVKVDKVRVRHAGKFLSSGKDT